MTKPMKYRNLARLPRDADFSSRPGKGDHEVWTGPRGVQTVVVRDTECSPKVTRDALAAIDPSTKED